MIRLLAIFLAISTPVLANVSNNDYAPDLGKQHTAEESASEPKAADSTPENGQMSSAQILESQNPNDPAANAGDDNTTTDVEVSALSVQSGAAEENLIQQTRIADYTADLVAISWWQVVVNALVAGCIFLTLLVTALTARAAQRSAKAAEDVVKQNRAWITLDPQARIDPPNIRGVTQVSIVWVNSGQSPALEVGHQTKVIHHQQIPRAARDTFDIDFDETELPWTRHGAIGENRTIYIFLGMTPEIIASARNQDTSLLVVTKIRYKSISGESGFTKTILEIQRLGDGGDGNAAYGFGVVGKQVCT